MKSQKVSITMSIIMSIIIILSSSVNASIEGTVKPNAMMCDTSEQLNQVLNLLMNDEYKIIREQYLITQKCGIIKKEFPTFYYEVIQESGNFAQIIIMQSSEGKKMVGWIHKYWLIEDNEADKPVYQDNHPMKNRSRDNSYNNNRNNNNRNNNYNNGWTEVN